jgi:hypothetical protein
VPVVDGLIVDGVLVDGVLVEGVTVDGLKVDGLGGVVAEARPLGRAAGECWAAQPASSTTTTASRARATVGTT